MDPGRWILAAHHVLICWTYESSISERVCADGTIFTAGVRNSKLYISLPSLKFFFENRDGVADNLLPTLFQSHLKVPRTSKKRNTQVGLREWYLCQRFCKNLTSRQTSCLGIHSNEFILGGIDTGRSWVAARDSNPSY
jgi:hypothetical protein